MLEYCCLNGVVGKICVKVKVNLNGNVIFVEVVGNVFGINQCFVENVIEYVYKLCFELFLKGIDEGIVIYIYYLQCNFFLVIVLNLSVI